MSLIYNEILSKISAGKKLFGLLIDPDKVDHKKCKSITVKAQKCGVDLILVGGSLLMSPLNGLINNIKQNCKIPVILFPGSPLQITPDADAILLLSLISGRNADFLIGHHVVAAPLLKKSGIEIIPTGYILVDCGTITSVAYMSNTLPVPYSKTDIAVATAMAGVMNGMKFIYLEGGSGAQYPVSTAMISEVKASIDVPLIVGGGIRTVEQAEQIYQAGADIVVVGTAIEKNTEKLEMFCRASKKF